MEIVEAQDMIEVQGIEGSPIHGDLFEAILSRVPLIDLASVSHVSKSWEYAVSSSLLHLNKVKPWLLIHTQSRRSLMRKTTLAYDPRSDVWIEIGQPQSSMSNEHFPVVLQSSNSNFLYLLSPNGLSFSVDPVHLTWLDIPPPHTWRTDPIVAPVGSHIIVAGGGSWFENEPMLVEMYDMETSHWTTCQSMPDIFKHSATSTWLSVASNQESMYLIEKATGILCSFSPIINTWAGPYNLKPGPGVLFSTIGFAGEDLILAGLVGYSENIVETLKIWKIKPEVMEFDEIGEIPEELLEKLKGEDSELSSISLIAAKDFIYICNSSNPRELILCELVDGEYWKWRSVNNVVLTDDRKIGERLVMSCGSVGIYDLHVAMRSGDLKLLAIS